MRIDSVFQMGLSSPRGSPTIDHWPWIPPGPHRPARDAKLTDTSRFNYRELRMYTIYDQKPSVVNQVSRHLDAMFHFKCDVSSRDTDIAYIA